MLAMLLHSSSPEINANAMVSLLIFIIFCIVIVGLLVYFGALPSLFRFIEKRLHLDTPKDESESVRENGMWAPYLPLPRRNKTLIEFLQ
jgi:nucleoside permease NupC